MSLASPPHDIDEMIPDAPLPFEPGPDDFAPDSPEAPASSTPMWGRALGVGLVAYLLLFALSLYGGEASKSIRPLPLLLLIGAGLFAGVSCLLRAKRSWRDACVIRAWKAVGTGTLLFTAGQIFRLYSITAQGTSPRWPGLIDLGVFGALPFYLHACLQLHTSTHTEGFAGKIWRTVLTSLYAPWGKIESIRYGRNIVDALIAVFSLSALGCVFLLQPVFLSPAPPVGKGLAVAYAVVGMGVLAGILFLALLRNVRERETAALPFLLSGIAVAALADVALVAAMGRVLLPAGKYLPGGLADGLWALAFGLIGYAAWQTGRRAPQSDEEGVAPVNGKRPKGHAWAGKLRQVFPYALPLAVSALIVFQDFRDDRHIGIPSILLVAGMFLLLIRRQVITSYENLDFAEILKLRVDERTEELQSTNAMLERQRDQMEKQAETLRDHQNVLEHQSARLDALNQIMVTASGSLEDRVILRETLKEIVNLLPKSWGGAYALVEGPEGAMGELVVSCADHVTPRLRPPDGLPCVPDGICSPLPRETWNRVILPLVSRDQTLGLFWVGVLDGAFSDDDLNLLDAMGALVGGALENARLYREAKERADRDSVTGLYNHRALQERLEQEIARAQRDKSIVSVIVMDLNKFKEFNDTYGHPFGDEVLRVVGKALKEVCRLTDIYGRHGGDEFLAILPGCTATEAVSVADRINEYLIQHTLTHKDETAKITVSVSAGVAVYPYDGTYRDTLLAFADENMYESKRRGGRAVAATEEVRQQRKLKAEENFGLFEAMIMAVDAKDGYTRHHSERVTRYSVWMAEHLGWKPEQVKALRLAGLLHDVGKIGVPDHILRKPERLNAQEEEVMRTHPALSALLVSAAPTMTESVPGVRHHHERWDGAGYPDRLAGEQIPAMARILAVAAAFASMTTDRPFRKALPLKIAVQELAKGAGTQFDPEMVKAFVEAVMSRYIAAEAEDRERAG